MKILSTLLLTFFLINTSPINCFILPLSLDDIELQKETQLTREKLKAAITFVNSQEEYWHPQWQYQYHTLVNMIKKHNLKRGAEIGVAFGGQSLAILFKTAVEKLYSIDPYYHFSSDMYPDHLNYNQSIFNVLYYLVRKKLEPFGERSQLLRMTSVKAAQLVKEGELDFLYIDGNHEYEYVKLDILSWFDKVRPGGFIVGDDWQAEGVRRAVNEFFKGYVIHRKNRMWWIQKKKKM